MVGWMLLFSLLSAVLLVGCAGGMAPAPSNSRSQSPQPAPDSSASNHPLPEELSPIPENYGAQADHQGTLEDLYYDTWESFSYDEHAQQLRKHAVVYLPYGYTEDRQYDVVYLMHGGWSDENTYLGTPEDPHEFHNVLDHAIEDGRMRPMIVVCPTYNNTSGEDSGDYGLALRLTDNYHQELLNDLMPAVEGRYSTYAEGTDPAGLAASRDHRAFCGFSMGSVATWRTFQYDLDYFRYFFPSSGALTGDGEAMADIVRSSGRQWDDFFIFAASGTDDFAYSGFRSQIDSMAAVQYGMFRLAGSEADGNLWFLEQEGGLHDGEYALEYFYNALCWAWNAPDSSGDAATESPGSGDPAASFTLRSTVGEVEADPAFGDYGRLLFPVDREVPEDMTLEEASSSSVYV